MVVYVNTNGEDVFRFNDESHWEDEPFVDVLPAHYRDATVDLVVYFDVVADVHNTVRFHTQYDDVG